MIFFSSSEFPLCWPHLRSPTLLAADRGCFWWELCVRFRYLRAGRESGFEAVNDRPHCVVGLGMKD